MIISHDHKFIFIHIGKTGGTSVEKVLCDHLNIDFEKTKKDEYGEWWKHIWAKGMRKRVGKKIWDEYFTFAFVRNPFDMILSLYSMYTQYPEYTNLQQHPNLYHPWNQFESFDKMVLGMGLCQHESDEIWRRQLDQLNAKTHVDVWDGLQNLQTKYLTDYWKGKSGGGDILVDFVGRYENLTEDFHTVCGHLGLPCIDLIHHGKTRHEHYTKSYSSEAKQIVNDHFELDIARFGYSF